MADMFIRVRLQAEGWSQDLRLTQRTVSPIRIGTGETANIRVPKRGGEGDYEFALYRSGEAWNISVGEGVTCLAAGGRGGAISRAPLQSGMALSMMGTRDGRVQQVLYVQVDLQFDLAATRFNRYVVIRDIGSITIGGQGNCDIRLGTSATQTESVTLARAASGWVLRNNNCRYSVYRNASEVKGEAQVKEGDFFSVGDVMFHIQGGNLYFDAEVPVQAGAFTLMDTEQKKRALKYPQFLRSTRVQHQVEMDEINLLPPKEKRPQEKENLFLKLLPAIVMLVALVVFRGMMGSGNITYMLYSVVTMGVSVIVSVLASKDQRKKAEEDEIRRKERYYQYIDTKIQEIKERRQDELRILERIYRSPEDNIAIVRNFEKGLFDRSSKDGDFLDIRLGSGRREATIKVKTNIPEYKQLDDDLQDRVQEIVQEYKYLDNAPIVARLGQANSIGVVGSRKWLYEMLKVMTVDLMVRQYYKELRIYYVIDEKEQEQFAWARWLKNCTRDTDTIRTILCDAESTKFHLENIYKVISEREMNSGDRASWRSHYVIFAYHIDPIRNHPISNYFETCGHYGFHFIFMDEHEQRIPRGCSQMVQLDRMVSSGHLFYTANGENKMQFDYVPVVEDRMRELVSRLNPVYVMESSLEEQLTKSITFYEMLGIDNINQIDLGGNWRKAQVEKTLAAPLGVKTKNAIVMLDLHDSAKAHGPHGLVAGTTGSGKSEILQSYILSMALHYHPYEVSFLLIDFKGGGMANQFRDLPHLAGCITDIDGREINRSLKSIRAEQERRKKFFAQVEVNNIHKYIAKYKADPSSVPAPLPHLIIIVDEFAELKTEQPEFMKELISTARVGRSLGIHLILATQKPSGVVDPQIWSNSKFKLCLKVQTKEDSREMLHTPLAAEIREPGRAYLQVGNNEIFELFQSAYSGANIPNADPNAVRPFKLHELNMWGKRSLVYEQKAPQLSEEEKVKAKAQLDVIVDYIHDYCDDMAIKKLPSICMPPLPETISLDALDGVKGKNIVEGIMTSVAIYDDPEMQYQGDYVLNLTKTNTFILGSAQTGKTTLLQTIMCSVINNYTPEEVNFYIIDAGNSAMQAFEKAKHVGGVAYVQEEEKINNLFKMLGNMIQERVSKFMSMGIGTYHAYVEAGKRDMPQVVLVIDNIPAFREYYEQFDDTLQTLAREGLSAGISILVTGSASNNLNYRTMVNFGTKIALNCNDTSEYSSLFGVRGFAPFNFPGRGLVMLDNRLVEAQFALAVDAGADATEKERADMLSKLLVENAKKYQHLHVPSIPMVPQVLELSYVKEEAPQLLKQPYNLVLGMEYSQVEFMSLDLLEMGYLAVCGRAKFGKKNVVRLLLEQIQENIFIHLSDVYIFDGPKKELGDQRSKGCVKQYITATDDMLECINDLYEEIQDRQERLYSNEDPERREKMLKQWPMKMIVVNGDKPLSSILSNKEAATKMYNLIAKCQECKVFVLFSCYPTAKVGTINVTELQKYIQNTGNVFFMDNLRNMKMLEVTLAEAREHSKPIMVGDGFLRRNDMFYHIKTVKAK